MIPDATSDANPAVDAANDAATPLYKYTFDTSAQGWTFMQAFSAPLDAGLPTFYSDSTAFWTGTEGNPLGAFETYAAFDDTGGEKVQVDVAFNPPVDLTGRNISVDVFLAAGVQQLTYFYLYCRDQGNHWIDGGFTGFPAVAGGQWTTAHLNVSQPQGYVDPNFDTTHVASIGLEFDSGGGGSGLIVPVTVYIDNVIVQ